ncbi:unnamed protein product [Arctogadus glacialis]
MVYMYPRLCVWTAKEVGDGRWWRRTRAPSSEHGAELGLSAESRASETEYTLLAPVNTVFTGRGGVYNNFPNQSAHPQRPSPPLQSHGEGEIKVLHGLH